MSPEGERYWELGSEALALVLGTELAVGTLGKSLPFLCLGFLICKMGICGTGLVVKSK